MRSLLTIGNGFDRAAAEGELTLILVTVILGFRTAVLHRIAQRP